ncbi:hypothetical protein Taro_020104, partial [Colocasia esculenta]|nr:hypothetical protein [Colocasia esculenta]
GRVSNKLGSSAARLERWRSGERLGKTWSSSTSLCINPENLQRVIIIQSVDTLSQIGTKGFLGRSLVSTLPDPVSTLPDPVSTLLDPVSTLLDPMSTLLDPVSTPCTDLELGLVSTLLDPVSTLLDHFFIFCPVFEALCRHHVDTLSQIGTKGFLGRSLVSTLPDPMSTLPDPVSTLLDHVSTLPDPVSTLLDPVSTPCTDLLTGYSGSWGQTFLAKVVSTHLLLVSTQCFKAKAECCRNSEVVSTLDQ